MTSANEEGQFIYYCSFSHLTREHRSVLPASHVCFFLYWFFIVILSIFGFWTAVRTNEATALEDVPSGLKPKDIRSAMIKQTYQARI